MMVLSSLAPLFVLWAVRGMEPVPDGELRIVCAALIIIPTGVLLYRIYVARSSDLRDITVASLRRACRLNSIPVDSSDGTLAPLKGQELAFLNLLDRRRYVVSLLPRKHEQYEAGSRKNIGIRARAGEGQAEAATAAPKGS